jgi:hypothetical protein
VKENMMSTLLGGLLFVGAGISPGFCMRGEMDRREVERWKRCAMRQGRFIQEALKIELGEGIKSAPKKWAMGDGQRITGGIEMPIEKLEIEESGEAELHWVREARVGAMLGVCRNEIRGLRQKLLEEGVSWRIGNGRRVEISSAGIQILARATGTYSVPEGTQGEKSRKSTLIQKNAGSSVTLGLVGWPRACGEVQAQVVTVCTGRVPVNRKVLQCVALNEQRVIVRVRDNSLFLPGMKLAAWPGRDGGPWEFAGQPGKNDGRMPRGRGRW